MTTVEETYHRKVQLLPPDAPIGAATFTTSPASRSSVVSVKTKQPAGFIHQREQRTVKIVSYPGAAQQSHSSMMSSTSSSAKRSASGGVVGVAPVSVNCPHCMQFVTTTVQRETKKSSCCCFGSSASGPAFHFCPVCDSKINGVS